MLRMFAAAATTTEQSLWKFANILFAWLAEVLGVGVSLRDSIYKGEEKICFLFYWGKLSTRI